MEILNEVRERSMVDPSILDTPAFKPIEKEYREEIRKGPDYICDICWKNEYRTNVIELNPSKYDIKLFVTNVILIKIVMIKRLNMQGL